MTIDSRLTTHDLRSKAVFLDRDGVINELVYYEEHGLRDSPATVEQMRVFPWAGKAIRQLREAGFKVILVSNQPGIAKGHFSRETFEKIRLKMVNELAREGAVLDGEYYCFHHPEAKVQQLKVNCDCRKPKPGMLFKAAEELSIDLTSSWMIGDGLTDIQAGKEAGCRAILIGRMRCDVCSLMEEMGTRPDAVVSDLQEASKVIIS